MRVAVLVAAALGAVLAVGAGLAWDQGWLREVVSSDAVMPAQAQAGASDDLDVTARFDLAIRRHDAAEVAEILASGADPDSVDETGETLLNKAVLFGTPEIVGIMLDGGADPDLPGPNGLGPLAIAALAGRHESLERLMEATQADAVTSPPVSTPLSSLAPTLSAPRHGRPAAVGAEGSALPAAQARVGGAEARPGVAPQPAPAARTKPAPAASASAVPSSSPPTVGAAGGPATTASLAPALAPGPSAVATDPTDADVVSGPGGVPTAWIVAVQRRLGELGYYKGAADGVAGPQTANAITSYQAVAGLQQDGLVSEDLMLRIGAKIDAQPRSASTLRPVSVPPARPLGPAEMRGDQPAARPDG